MAESADAAGRSPLAPAGIAPLEASPEPASSTSPSDPQPGEDRLHSALSTLRSAIEAGTYERLDPTAIVEAAERILELELAEGALPEITDSGQILVPFLDVPDGIDAYLTIGRSRGYGTVAGIDIELAPREGSNYLDGSVRGDARCSIRAWRDPSSQAPLHLSLMTNLDPDYPAMRAAGLSLDGGKFVMGVKYVIDVNDPSRSAMKAHGLQNGSVADWEVPLWLDGPDLSARQAGRLADRIYQRLEQLDKRKER